MVGTIAFGARRGRLLGSGLRLCPQSLEPVGELGQRSGLATSVEFFLYARIDIFDMMLTFLTTLTLLEFYRAANAADKTTRRRHCFLMYTAMGFATLVKGPSAS